MRKDGWKLVAPTQPTKKDQLIKKKKSQITDKEVLSLTGGLLPQKVAQSVVVHQVNHDSQRNIPWVRVPIVQKNQDIGAIFHWVKVGEEKKLYLGEKFNVEPSVLTFTRQEYESLGLCNPEWSYQLVQQVFDLLRTFCLNFIVVQDRLKEELTVEDIKEIYYTVSRLILQKRGETQHPLAKYTYDKKFQCNRKLELEKYLLRNKVDTNREKYLITEIRRLEILIKKEEREQINLKKALKIDQVPDDIFEINKADSNLTQLRKEQKVFTRQQYLSKPLMLPAKINDRLAQVLRGMNIPEKLIATEENMRLYDQLRKKVLLMFSTQRYLRRREVELRSYEEKKRKRLPENAEQKNNGSKQELGVPKKKIHVNQEEVSES